MKVTPEDESLDRPSSYEYIEGIESLDEYRPGGLPVLYIGDVLDSGRYKILHKLGHGGSSTTWLARNQDTTELVAIKACTHESSERSREADYMSSLCKSRLVRRLLASFTLLGPNGSHRCLVVEPATCSLFAAKIASFHQLLSLRTAREIVADLIRSVRYFHSQSVIHGDIHAGNILLRFPDSLRNVSDDELYKRIHHPIQHAVVRLDGKSLSPNVPSVVYEPAWLSVPSDKIPEDLLPIMVSDLGEAFDPTTTERRHARTLPALTPPESLLAEEVGIESMSFPSEIWTLACTIFEIMGSRSPFDLWDSSKDKILFEHVAVLGKLPELWWTSWEGRSQHFDEEATHDIQGAQSRSLNDSLMQRYEWCIASPRRRQNMELPGVEEKRAFLNMMNMMLRLDPYERSSIFEVAQSE